MSKKTAGFFHVWSLFLIIAIGVVVAVGVFVVSKNKNSNGSSSLPNCPAGKQLLQYSPVAEADLTTIVPLGNLAPPGHILPTSHMYFNFVHNGTGSGSYPAKTNIIVPADMTATRMLKINTKNSFTEYDAYRIEFVICKQVSGYFILVQQLNEKLAAAYDNTSFDSNSENKTISVPLSAGELLGSAGGAQGYPDGIDFTISDTRSSPPVLANPARWNDSGKHFSCALDYFSPELSSRLYAKIGGFSYAPKDPGEPKCGTVYQDVPGSAQGVWVTREYGDKEIIDTEDVAALVHSNLDHSRRIFSFGSKITKVGIDNKSLLGFVPEKSGTRNLDFNLVTDDKVYCYTVTNDSRGEPFNKSVLIQLVDSTTLRVGTTSSSCAGQNHKLETYVEYIR